MSDEIPDEKESQLSNLNLLKVKQIQEILNIGKDKAYELVHSEELPSIQIGKSYRVRECDLRRWLENKLNLNDCMSGNTNGKHH